MKLEQAKFYLGITVIAIVSLSVLRVIMTNSISTNGIALARIQTETQEYKKQNSLLHEQVLAMSSLNYISSRAANLGFVQSKTQIVLTSPLPIAYKR